MYSRAKAALLSLLVVSGAAVVTAVVGYVMASPTFGWTGAALAPRLHQPWSCPTVCHSKSCSSPTGHTQRCMWKTVAHSGT